MKWPRLSAMRFWLAGMIAVCGIGRPSGRLNSATTAYQSAIPPIVAASAKAATKPSHGQRGCNDRAAANTATHRQSAAVARNFVRRNAASFAASCESGATMEATAASIGRASTDMTFPFRRKIRSEHAGRSRAPDCVGRSCRVACSRLSYRSTSDARARNARLHRVSSRIGLATRSLRVLRLRVAARIHFFASEEVCMGQCAASHDRPPTIS